MFIFVFPIQQPFVRRQQVVELFGSRLDFLGLPFGLELDSFSNQLVLQSIMKLISSILRFRCCNFVIVDLLQRIVVSS